MSVYVGIDVHRKRSQVAVVTEDGKVQVNKNVVNGSEPMLRLIGDLPAGTPVAFEAAFGWGWLAELLEDYGFEAHLVHPLRCEDRHHRDLPQAPDPRLAPAGRHAGHRHDHAAAAAMKTGGSPSPGHARPFGMSRRQRRARSSD